MRGHPQYWIEGKDHHSCWQYLAAQGTIVGTLLVHVQLSVQWDSQILLCQVAFQIVAPTPCIYWFPGLVLSQVQGFAIPMAEFQDVPISPFLQPVEAPPDALPPVLCFCWEYAWPVLSRVLGSVDSWHTHGTLCRWSPLSDHKPGPGHPDSFHPPCHWLILHFISFSGTLLQGIVSKALLKSRWTLPTALFLTARPVSGL